MAEKKEPSPTIVWLDLEMTGLHPEVDQIIEIASIVTDRDLNIIAEGPEIVIQQPAERFEKMDDWNKEHHTASGLWAKVVASNTTVADAEEQTLTFLKQFTSANVSPLAGSSIWQDRRFLNAYMRKLDEFLHYRMIDVSSFKEMIQRWYPAHPRQFEKKNSHRALEDIRESINELKFYRAEFFK